MKEKILFPIVSLFIGACVGGAVVYAIDSNKIKEKEDEIMEIQSVLDEGRDAMIKTNIYVNEFAKKLFIGSFVDGNTNAAVASKTLEALFPELLKLNKSLKRDCTEYKNGAPVSTTDEYGNSNPVETLPEEKRILK